MENIEDLRHAFMTFTLSLPRVLIAFTLLPVFSRQILPGMTRNGVAASLMLLVAPLNIALAPSPLPGLPELAAIVLKESFIGLVIGFCAALPFWIIDSTGFFIDNQRGTSMASSIDPMTGSQTSPLGLLFTQTLTVLFFLGGGILAFLGFLYESYRVWPVFSLLPKLEGPEGLYFLDLLDYLMALTVLLAAPVIIAMFLGEFALALISRITPQMNVFSLSMPIKSGVGIFILVSYVGVLFAVLGDEVWATTGRFSDLIALLR